MTPIFGIATIWRRIKPCPISKKIRKKEENGIFDLKKSRMSDLISVSNLKIDHSETASPASEFLRHP